MSTAAGVVPKWAKDLFIWLFQLASLNSQMNRASQMNPASQIRGAQRASQMNRASQASSRLTSPSSSFRRRRRKRNHVLISGCGWRTSFVQYRVPEHGSQNRDDCTYCTIYPPLSCRQQPPLHAHFRHYSMLPTLLRGVACLETDCTTRNERGRKELRTRMPHSNVEMYGDASESDVDARPSSIIPVTGVLCVISIRTLQCPSPFKGAP